MEEGIHGFWWIAISVCQRKTTHNMISHEKMLNILKARQASFMALVVELQKDWYPSGIDDITKSLWDRFTKTTTEAIAAIKAGAA